MKQDAMLEVEIEIYSQDRVVDGSAEAAVLLPPNGELETTPDTRNLSQASPPKEE